MKKSGTVYIVGAGPGDYGLMTIKGLECVRKADVIIYDRLICRRILADAKKGAELIYAGKAAADHSMRQDDINALLAEKAEAGKTVVRLKGGDPYIFGRGGEEALFLRKRNIKFEVVPGVSSFAAVPAYAGIPVTHRGLASTAAIITGHEDPSKAASDIDWSGLATIGTLVFFMGIKNLPDITASLINHGKSPDVPAAIVRYGTTPRQRTLVSTLGEISREAARLGFTPPAMLVVGETVKLRDGLGWFEEKPLFSKRIVVTRARAQASEIASKLEELGAEVIELPAIEISSPSDDFASMDSALDKFERYELIIFTSANGVSRFLEFLRAKKMDIRALWGKKIAVIGDKTAEALEKLSITADLVPREFRAEALAEAVTGAFSGKKPETLIIRAEEAREVLPEKLTEAGFKVDIACPYKISGGEIDAETLELVRSGEIDMVTFASSKTVENFIAAIGRENISKWGGRVKFAAIGPVTAGTCAQNSMPPDIVAEKYTIERLVEAITSYYSAGAGRR